MKSGQWMELRQDTRPPRTRERRPATGARATWWPQNLEWRMIQWLPRERGPQGARLLAMAQGTDLRGAESNTQQTRNECDPERLMTQATADKRLAGRGDKRSPRIRPKRIRKDANTPWSKKEKTSEGTGPWKGADSWPRKRQPTEPGKMSRTRTADETVDHSKQAGMQTRQNTKVRPAKRHAVLIALGPDGEYMQPGEKHRESATVDIETPYMSATPREAAQRRPMTQLDGCTSTWTCPEGLRRTGPHTGDTWSLRLRGGTGSSSGALCTCNALIKVQRGPQTDVTALIQAVADKMASKKGRARTIHSLLRDLAVFVRERSGDEDRQTTAEENYVTVLQAMQNDEMEPWDVSPTGDISPTGDQDGNPDRGRLTVETASKGLGLAGKVHVPHEMWDRLRPCNWAEVHEGAAEQKASRDIKLAAMIQRVHADGLIDRVQDGRRPNAKAFTKHKSASKGAMILNMVPLNARCPALGQRIKLPTLENLGDTFREAARVSRTMWFCKLHVANMFWSCWVPEEEKSAIRIGVMDEVWGFHNLPFGWTHSPVIGTELLAKTLAKFDMPCMRPVTCG